jgi:hypothetical protein
LPWTTAAEVKKYALVKWDSLDYSTSPAAPFANEAAFDSFLTDILIPRAQAHINRHCRRDFDADYLSGVPEDIKDICARVAANMIQYMVMNKMGPLIRAGDYQLSIPRQAVLTDEIKADLAEYVKKSGPVFYDQPMG